MAWKYEERLLVFDGCPPNELAVKAQVAYRFVQTGNHPNNFLPPAMIPGALYPGCQECCNDFSLSLFTDAERAAERLRELHRRNPAFVKRCGSQLATVTINATDGECGKPSKRTTHFEFFEYADADLSAQVTFRTEIDLDA